MRCFNRSQSSIALLMLLLGLASLLFVAGCKSSTKPDETGGVSGKVALIPAPGYSPANPTDYSGVKVALYHPATLDTTIVRINSAHPGIGVEINQETEFDHRLQSPVATTTTGVDGSFSFSGLTAGDYNIAFLKEGWSVKYLLNVNVAAQNVTNVGNLSIPQSIGFNTTVDAPTTFKSDTSYFITNTVNFMAPVTIEKGARIYVDKNESLRFNNTVTIAEGSSEDAYWKLDSSENLYQTTKSSIDSTMFFGDVTLNEPASGLSSGLVRHVYDGIKLNTANAFLTDVQVYDFSTGVSFGDTGVCDRVCLRNGRVRGIHSYSLNGSATVKKSIIAKVIEGFLVAASGGFTVEDSYFIDNDTSIFPQDCSGSVQHCCFERNTYDIRELNANTNIQYNNFYSNKYIAIYPRRLATISNNNFYQTDYMFISIRMELGPHFSIVDSDLLAEQNYWAPVDPEEFLLDSGDNHLYPNQGCWFDIDCLPKKTSRVVSAGVRN